MYLIINFSRVAPIVQWKACDVNLYLVWSKGRRGKWETKRNDCTIRNDLSHQNLTTPVFVVCVFTDYLETYKGLTVISKFWNFYNYARKFEIMVNSNQRTREFLKQKPRVNTEPCCSWISQIWRNVHPMTSANFVTLKFQN